MLIRYFLANTYFQILTKHTLASRGVSTKVRIKMPRAPLISLSTFKPLDVMLLAEPIFFISPVQLAVLLVYASHTRIIFLPTNFALYSSLWENLKKANPSMDRTVFDLIFLLSLGDICFVSKVGRGMVSKLSSKNSTCAIINWSFVTISGSSLISGKTLMEFVHNPALEPRSIDTFWPVRLEGVSSVSNPAYFQSTGCPSSFL